MKNPRFSLVLASQIVPKSNTKNTKKYKIARSGWRLAECWSTAQPPPGYSGQPHLARSWQNRHGKGRASSRSSIVVSTNLHLGASLLEPVAFSRGPSACQPQASQLDFFIFFEMTLVFSCRWLGLLRPGAKPGRHWEERAV